MTDGFGKITWWGFSPAVDLQDIGVTKTLEKLTLDEGKDVLNILLVGAGDVRHILKTIARRKRHTKKKINLYVLETSLELYARHLLLMTVALECQTRMGLQEKSELFLELFGNILVRDQTCRYIQKMSTEFIKMVTDVDFLARKLPILDFSQLKFKERDFLEGIFKFWRNSDPNAFEASKCWDLRMRQYLGSRYDSRLNTFDWDYHMKLAEIGADMINKSEYQIWRDTGVAFQIREGSYTVPNKTLASITVFQAEGEKHARRGYWGDVLVSPYVTLGLETEEKSFFTKRNGVYVKTAEDIAQYNILSMFHELATGQQYVLPKSDDNGTTEISTIKLKEIIEEDENEENAEGMSDCVDADELPKDVTSLDADYEPLPVDDVTVTFLPIVSLGDLARKSKYQNLFHMAYFSNSMVHLLKPEINPTFVDGCLLVLETAKYMLELKKEQAVEFVQKLQVIAEAAGCKVLESCDEEKDSFVKFIYEKH